MVTGLKCILSESGYCRHNSLYQPHSLDIVIVQTFIRGYVFWPLSCPNF
jgi:hypothetical protein